MTTPAIILLLDQIWRELSIDRLSRQPISEIVWLLLENTAHGDRIRWDMEQDIDLYVVYRVLQISTEPDSVWNDTLGSYPSTIDVGEASLEVRAWFVLSVFPLLLQFEKVILSRSAYSERLIVSYGEAAVRECCARCIGSLFLSPEGCLAIKAVPLCRSRLREFSTWCNKNVFDDIKNTGKLIEEFLDTD